MRPYPAGKPNNGSRSTKHTRASFSTLHEIDARRAMKYQQQNTGTSRHFDGGAFIFRTYQNLTQRYMYASAELTLGAQILRKMGWGKKNVLHF